jgi:predicted transcriptional regulator
MAEGYCAGNSVAGRDFFFGMAHVAITKRIVRSASAHCVRSGRRSVAVGLKLLQFCNLRTEYGQEVVREYGVQAGISVRIQKKLSLPWVRVFAYLLGMEVHFTPEQEAQLSRIARITGTDVEQLVQDAALRVLQEDTRFREAVREGIAQADRGEFIEESEMDARIEQMLRS